MGSSRRQAMRQGNKDDGGEYITLSQITLLTNINWLDIINRNKGKKMHLCTYGNPDGQKMCYVISKIENGQIIIGTSESEQEWEIMKLNNVIVRYDTHAKMLLISPDEVYLSSQNIEYDNWYQTTVHIKDVNAYNHYLNQFNAQWVAERRIKKWCTKTSILSPEDTEKSNPFNGSLNETSESLVLNNCKCKLVAMKTWKTKLNSIKQSNIIITTQTLPNQKYVCECLNKLVENNNEVTLVVNAKPKLVQKLKKIYPNIIIYHCANIHSKMLIHANKSVWLSSQNFGNSGEDWFECAIQIRNKRACEFYREQLIKFLGSNKPLA